MTKLTAQEWGLYIGQKIICENEDGSYLFCKLSGLIYIEKDNEIFLSTEKLVFVFADEFKPVLRDLSQMTDDEKKEFSEKFIMMPCKIEFIYNNQVQFTSFGIRHYGNFCPEQIDWLTRKGFAIRGEFERGVAVRES